MNELFRTAAVQWLKLNVMSTVYAAVGLTTASVTSLITPLFLEISVWTAFVVGFFLPMGPVYLYAASERAMTRKLGQIKRWLDADLITSHDAELLRRQMIEWYGWRVCPGRQKETVVSIPTGRHTSYTNGARDRERMDVPVDSETASTVQKDV